MGFTDSFKKVIGLGDIRDDEIVTEEELKAEKKKIEVQEKKDRDRDYSYGSTATSRAQSYGGRTSSEGSKASDKRFSVTNSNALKLVLIEPKKYDDAQKLVDNLKARKPVIINLEKLETDVARKIFDFLNGAIYALDGGVKKIANNIFIFTPKNVSVDGDEIPQELTSGDGQWG